MCGWGWTGKNIDLEVRTINAGPAWQRKGFCLEERVRIVDIAEELGVSTATVSNVIHGKTKKISDRTVKRVQELLEKRQYIPSMAGILLSQNNSRIIGVVVHDHRKYEGKVLEDAFVASSLNALVFELEKSGYFMMVKATKDWNEIVRFASMWNMDGLVLIGFCESDYEKLREKMHIPFVVYDGYFKENKRICNLIIDNYDGGRQVGDYLRHMGHRRILCIADNNTCVDKDRMDGCREGAEGCQVDWLEIPMNRRERERFYHDNLERIRRYTAVFVASDAYAVEFMYLLQKQGVAIPKEMSVVGFDNTVLSRSCYPALTTVGQDAVGRARAAIEALGQLRQGNCQEPVRMLSVELMIRESVKKR